MIHINKIQLCILLNCSRTTAWNNNNFYLIMIELLPDDRKKIYGLLKGQLASKGA